MKASEKKQTKDVKMDSSNDLNSSEEAQSDSSDNGLIRNFKGTNLSSNDNNSDNPTTPDVKNANPT